MEKTNFIYFVLVIASAAWLLFWGVTFLVKKQFGWGFFSLVGGVPLGLLALGIYHEPKYGDTRQQCIKYTEYEVTKELKGYKYKDMDKKCVKTLKEVFVPVEGSKGKWFEVID